MSSETLELMTNQIHITEIDDMIDRASAGDRSAFDHIMILHQRKVTSIAMRMLGNKEDALDAAQESFLRAYKYLKKYDSSQEFSPWLFRIVINVCHDIARKRIRNQFTSFEANTDSENNYKCEPASIENIETNAMHTQLIEIALASLSEKERAYIMLRDIEGFSTNDTAKILKCRPSTVRSAISTARKKLRDYLKQNSINNPGRKSL